MTENRAIVDGIGGVFIYADDAKALADWYVAHLGIPLGTYEEGKNYGLEFKYTNIENPSVTDATVFSIQAATAPLGKERNQVRVNYRVRDLTGLLRQLRAANIEIQKEEDYAEYGRFAWIHDPEGNKIELYQPAG
ncbi:MAG: VOC family protein [Gemmatimonadota bacterium]|nr:VOC family protein [Gemmatimonadota bacterium]